jgi:hypothetical protein
MIVAVTSVRGAPGVTTWSLLLAAAWPAALGTERVVLEADPDGGVLGSRYDLGVEPGVVSLVSSLRRHDAPVDLDEHARRVAPGVWVLPGPENADQAAAAWTSGAPALAGRVADDDTVWVVDCGRVGGRDPHLDLVRSAAAVVLVSGCRREDLVQLPGAVDRLADLAPGADVGIVFVGRLDYRRAEIAEFVGTTVLGVVAHDPDALTIAASAVHGGRGRRSLLWRSALEIAADVAQRATVAAQRAAPATEPVT